MDDNIFVTGPSGSGKSTLIREVIDELELDVQGISTPDIRKEGTRKGFKLVDISTGEEGVLAHVDRESGPRVSKYRVNLADLNRFVERCLRDIISSTDVVVIDEIGTMELFSDEFEEAVRELLDSDVTVLAVLHRNYVDEYGAYGRVFRLDGDYEDVKDKVKEMIEGP